MAKDIKELIEVKKRVSDVRQLFGLSREPPIRNILGRIRALKNQSQGQQGQQPGILGRLFPQAQQTQEPIAQQQPRQSATEHPVQQGQHDVVQASQDYVQDQQTATTHRDQRMSVNVNPDSENLGMTSHEARARKAERRAKMSVHSGD